MDEDLTELTKEELINRLCLSDGAFRAEFARRMELEEKIGKLRDALVDVLSSEFVSRNEMP